MRLVVCFLLVQKRGARRFLGKHNAKLEKGKCDSVAGAWRCSRAGLYFWLRGRNLIGCAAKEDRGSKPYLEQGPNAPVDDLQITADASESWFLDRREGAVRGQQKHKKAKVQAVLAQDLELSLAEPS